MRKSQLITRILLSAALAPDAVQADRLFLTTFTERYSESSLTEWDRDVPEYIANVFLSTVDTEQIDVQDLIRDLDILYNKMV